MNKIYYCRSCYKYVAGNMIEDHIGSGILLPYQKQCRLHPGISLVNNEFSVEEALAMILNKWSIGLLE